MLIDGQCAQSFSNLAQTVNPHEKWPAGLMAQENGHAFAQAGSQPALVGSSETIAECTTRVDELLSKHNELAKQQVTVGSELQSLKCEEAELRLKIQNLEKPLDNVDAVTLTEEELAVIQAVQSDDGDVNSSGPCEMDARDIPSRCRGICESAVDVSMDCADDRLQPQPDAAQQDPLRSQRQSDHADVHASGVARVFGRVPAFSPLPDDPTAAMILSCNRYTSSVSHLDTFQTMGRACNSVQGAQHYMSGRHHVVFMQPTCGAFWGLPVVQKGIEEHAEQADELAAALQKMLIEREVREDNTAASLAVQLAYTQPTPVPHNEALPRRVNVRAHMHNFTCYIPSQLDEHSRWRSSFVDSNRLVTDPKQELHLPKFTKPWTKAEKEAMEAVLGESGKKFAEVASKVGTRSIAECIDRYYKIHLKDEFKPTWRKMARLKRAGDGRNKRNEESKVLATVTRVPRHRYDSLPRHDQPTPASTWRFPPVSDERLRMVPPVTARDFDSTPLTLGAEDSLKGYSRTNSRKRPGSVLSPGQPLSLPKTSLDDAVEPLSLLRPGGISFADLRDGGHSVVGGSASLPVGGSPPLAGVQPLSASASLLPLPEVPTKHAFPKVGGSVQPSLKFQMNSAAAPPMQRPVPNGSVDHGITPPGGQLQNPVPVTPQGELSNQPDGSDAYAGQWQKQPHRN